MTAITSTVRHYHRPSHADRYMDNTRPCCDRPAEEHPPFVDGVEVRVALTRQFRRLNGKIVPKGTVLLATRESYEAMHVISPSRWGTNVLGQFAEEFERAVIDEVRLPGYRLRFGDDKHWTSLSPSYLKEVAS